VEDSHLSYLFSRRIKGFVSAMKNLMSVVGCIWYISSLFSESLSGANLEMLRSYSVKIERLLNVQCVCVHVFNSKFILYKWVDGL
jgi:hypothetical protein